MSSNCIIKKKDGKIYRVFNPIILNANKAIDKKLAQKFSEITNKNIVLTDRYTDYIVDSTPLKSRSGMILGYIQGDNVYLREDFFDLKLTIDDILKDGNRTPLNNFLNEKSVEYSFREDTENTLKYNGEIKEITTEKGEKIKFSSKRAADNTVSKPKILWETGDVQYVSFERQLSENGSFSFQGKDKISSTSDVATIFRNLQDESSENMFALMANEKGEYEVLYLSTGNTNATMVDTKLIKARAVTFGATKVWLIHNHPSGALKASDPDRRLLKSIKSAFDKTGVEVQDGIIINLDSGKYVTFDAFYDGSVNDFQEETGDLKDVEVKQFRKQVLYEKSSERTVIKSSLDAAQFLSKQKRGITGKIGVIVLAQNNAITRYTLYDETEPIENIYRNASVDVGVSGEAIIFVADQKVTADKLNDLNDLFKDSQTRVVDVVVVESNEQITKNYISYADEMRLKEPDAFYGKENVIQQAIQRNNNLPLTQAPNGNPSVLYQSYKDLGYTDQEAERLVAQTYTDEFGNWFGRWWDLGGGAFIWDIKYENNRPSKEVDTTLSEFINKNSTQESILEDIEYDINLLEEEEAAKTKFEKFEELIKSSLDKSVFLPELNRFMEIAILNTEATPKSIEKAFQESKSILDADGSIDQLKIENAEFLKGDIISDPLFERFANENPEYMGVYKDWKNLFDNYINTSLKNKRGLRSYTKEPLIKAKNYLENNTIKIVNINTDGSVSKVVDTNGQPLVVYHASNQNITIFDREKSKQEDFDGFLRDFYDTSKNIAKGTYFTPTKEVVTRGFKRDFIIPTFLNIKNDIELDFKGSMPTDVQSFEKASNKFLITAAGQAIEKGEVDGFILRNAPEYGTTLIPDKDQYLVYKPTQIKSATENIGTFDQTNPDIRYNVVGEKGANNVKEFKDSLERAKQLEKQNVPIDEIERQTGWFKEKGDWKYFSQDLLNKFDIIDEVDYNKEYTLDTILKDNSILKLYPQLKDTKVKFYAATDTKNYTYNQRRANGFTSEGSVFIKRNDLSNSNKGYDPGREMGDFSPNLETKRQDDRKDNVLTLLHEVQHLVQQEEGFPEGGDRDSVIREAFKIVGLSQDDRITKLREVAQQKIDDGVSEEQKKILLAAINYVDTLERGADDGTVLQEQYRLLFGEVEARFIESLKYNNENPLNLTYTELKNQYKDLNWITDEFVVRSSQEQYSIIGEQGAEALDKAEEATYRLDALEKARQMEIEMGLEIDYWKKKGKNINEKKKIKQLTSWERGADGLWRYEVPDNITAVQDLYNLNAKEEGEVSTTASFLVSRELNKAYPGLKDVKVKINISPGLVRSGNYNRTSVNDVVKNRFIEVEAGDIQAAQSVLIHEIQHYLQEVEGFATGDNYMRNFKYSIEESTILSDYISSELSAEEYLKKQDVKELNEALELNLEDLLLNKTKEEIRDLLTEDSEQAYSTYRKNAGETEARNTEKRMYMSPQERASTLLEETEDVAREDQILLINSLAAYSQEPPTTPKDKQRAKLITEALRQKGFPLNILTEQQMLEEARKRGYNSFDAMVEKEFKGINTYKVYDDLENTSTITLEFEQGSVTIGEVYGLYDFLEVHEDSFKDSDFFIEIQDLQIKPEYQGEGLGKVLLKDTIKYIEDRYGNIDIYLNASPIGNKKLSAQELSDFYSKEGFIELEDEGSNVTMLRKGGIKLNNIQFLSKNEKIYGFYDNNTKQIYLTEELLNTNTLVHELYHFYKPILKEQALQGNKATAALLNRYNDIADTILGGEEKLRRYFDSVQNKPQVESLYFSDESNFEKWKGGNELVYGAEVQDVRTGQPIVARVYHGTTNEFYEFDSSVKGNVEGHLGRVNYFTTDYQDASMNYGTDGADITGRGDIRQDELENNLRFKYTKTEEGLVFQEIIDDYNLTEDDITNLYPNGKPEFVSEEEISRFLAEKELLGGTEKVLDLYVKLNNPVVLGDKSTWFETLNVSEEDLETAAEEIAEENDITIEEAKEDFNWEIRDRAIENTGYENLHIDALRDALNNNGYDGSKVYEILGDNYYETEVDLNQLEKDLRKAELYENDNGEIAGSQVIAEFFKNLGFDGIILTDVSQRFRNMGLGGSTSHIHVFDEFSNQIKLADGTNTTFSSNTNDIRYQIIGEKGASPFESEVYAPRANESFEQYQDRMREESISRLLGENSTDYFEKMAKEAGLDEKETKSFIDRVKQFIKDFANWLKKQLGLTDITPEQVASMTNKELFESTITSMLRGDYMDISSATKAAQETSFMILGEKGVSNIKPLVESLNRAKLLLNDGVSIEQIERETGWFKENNDWKYFSKEALEKFNLNKESFVVDTEQNLSDIVTDNIIFEAYPQLKNVKVKIYDGTKETETNKANASGYTSQGTIFLNSRYTDIRDGVEDSRGEVRALDDVNRTLEDLGNRRSALYTLAHEVTHLIQEIEGFPTGGNTSTVIQKAKEIIKSNKANLGALRDDINLALYSKNLTEEEEGILKSAYTALNTYFATKDENVFFEQYKLLAGEVEARFIEYLKENYNGEDISYLQLKDKYEVVNDLKNQTVVRQKSLPQMSDVAKEAQDYYKREADRLPYTLQVFNRPEFVKMHGKQVNPITVLNLLNQSGIKQVEKDLIRNIIDTNYQGQKKISYDELEATVRANIMPLERLTTTSHSDYGMDNLGNGDYGSHKTIIFNAPVEHGVIGHFPGDFKASGRKNIKYVPKQLNDNTWIAVEEGYESQANPNNIYQFVGTSGTKEAVESWISDRSDDQSYIERLNELEAKELSDLTKEEQNEIEKLQKRFSGEINKGMFGHIRVWQYGEVFIVAEMQSDFFQKNNARKNTLESRKDYKEALDKKQKDEGYILQEREIYLKDEVHNDLLKIIEKNDRVTVKLHRLELYDGSFGEEALWLFIDDKPILVSQYSNEGYSEEMQRVGLLKGRNNLTTLKEMLGDDFANNLQKEYDLKLKTFSDRVSKVNKEFEKTTQEIISKLSPQEKQFIASQKEWEKRMVREAIKEAALSGATELLFPTPYTLSVIEGYVKPLESENSPYQVVTANNNDFLVIGDTIRHAGDIYVVVDNSQGDIEVKRHDYGQQAGWDKEGLETITDNPLIKDLITEIEIDGEQHEYLYTQDRLYVWETYSDGSLTFSQPKDYKSAEKEDFSIEKDLSNTQQTVARKYLEIADILEQERGDNFEIITDENGFDWYRTKIEESETQNPVIAFQVSNNNIPTDKKAPDSQLYNNIASNALLSEQNAEDIFTVVHSQEFLSEFGDWTQGEGNPSLKNEQGEPLLFYKTAAGVYDNYSDALKSITEGVVELGYVVTDDVLEADTQDMFDTSASDFTVYNNQYKINNSDSFFKAAEINADSNPLTKEGFINYEIRKGYLSDKKVKVDGEYVLKGQGETELMQLVNARLAQKDAEVYLGYATLKVGALNGVKINVIDHSVVEHEGKTYKKEDLFERFKKGDVEFVRNIVPNLEKFVYHFIRVQNYKTQKATPKADVKEKDKLRTNMLSVLNELGITVTTITEYAKNYKIRNGVDLSVEAIADVLNNVVAFADDSFATETLVEETAHMIIEAYKNSQEVEQALSDIESSEEWSLYAEEYYQKYSEMYKGEELDYMVRLEILGKVLANTILNNFQAEQSTTLRNTLFDLVSKFIEKIKQYFLPHHKAQYQRFAEKLNDVLVREDFAQFSSDNLLQSNAVLYSINGKTRTTTELIDKQIRALEKREKQLQRAKDPSAKDVASNIRRIREARDAQDFLGAAQYVIEALTPSINQVDRAIKALEKDVSKGKESFFNEVTQTTISFLENEGQEVVEVVKEMVGKIDPNLQDTTRVVRALQDMSNKISSFKGKDAFNYEKSVEKIVRDSLENANISKELVEKIVQEAVNPQEKEDINKLSMFFGNLTHVSNYLNKILGVRIQNDDFMSEMETKKNLDGKANKWVDNGWNSNAKYAALMKKDADGKKTGNFVAPLDLAKFNKAQKEQMTNILKSILGEDYKEDVRLSDLTTEQANEYHKQMADWNSEHQLQPQTKEFYEDREADFRAANVSQSLRDFLKTISRRKYNILQKYFDTAENRFMYEKMSSQDIAELKSIDVERKTKKSEYLAATGVRKTGDALADAKALQEYDRLRYERNSGEVDKVRDKFFSTIEKIEDADELEGRQKALEFFEANAGISFTDDYWEGLKLAKDKDGNDVSKETIKEIIDKAIIDIEQESPLDAKNLRELSEVYLESIEKRKQIIKPFQKKNNPAEIDTEQMTEITKENLIELDNDIMEATIRVNRILYKYNTEFIPSIMPTENDVNESYNKDLADSGLTEINFIKKNTTETNRSKIRSFESFVNDIKKGYVLDSRIPKYILKYLENTKNIEKDNAFEYLQGLTEQELDKLVLDYAKSRVASFYKRYAPVGYGELLKELKDGSARVSDILKDIKEGKYENIRISVNFEWLEGSEQPDTEYHKYKDDYGGVVPNPEYYKDQEYENMFGVVDGKPTKNVDSFKMLEDIKDWNKIINKDYGLTNRSLYSIPKKSRQTHEKAKSVVSKDGKTAIKELLAGVAKDRKDEKLYGDELEDTDVRTIPMYYVEDLEDNDYISEDILHSFAAMLKQASLYKHKKKSLSDVMIMLHHLENSKFAKGKQGKDSNAYKMFKEFMDSYYYGVRFNRSLKVNVGGQTLDISKMVNMFDNFQRKVNILFNPFIAASSAGSANLTLLVEKLVGQDIHIGSYSFAKQEIARMTAEYAKDYSGISRNNPLYKLMEKFGLRDIDKRYVYTGGTGAERAFSKSPAFLMETMAFPHQADLLISVLDDFRFVNGKFITFNQYKNSSENANKSKKEVELTWKNHRKNSMYNLLDKEGVQIDFKKEILDRIGREAADKNLLRAYSKIKELNTMVDAVLDKNDRPMSTRDPFANIAMAHTGWLTLGLQKRFKGRGLNLKTGEMENGTYRSVVEYIKNIYSLTKENGMGSLSGNFKRALEGLEEYDRRNLKRALIEYSLFALLSLIITSVVVGIDDDDENEDNWYAHMLSFMYYRTVVEYSSTLLPFNIKETGEKLQEPFMAISAYNRIVQGLDPFEWGEEIDRGKYEGFKKWQKTVLQSWWTRHLFDMMGVKEKSQYYRRQNIDKLQYLYWKKVMDNLEERGGYMDRSNKDSYLRM